MPLVGTSYLVLRNYSGLLLSLSPVPRLALYFPVPVSCPGSQLIRRHPSRCHVSFVQSAFTGSLLCAVHSHNACKTTTLCCSFIQWEYGLQRTRHNPVAALQHSPSLPLPADLPATPCYTRAQVCACLCSGTTAITPAPPTSCPCSSHRRRHACTCGHSMPSIRGSGLGHTLI